MLLRIRMNFSDDELLELVKTEPEKLVEVLKPNPQKLAQILKQFVSEYHEIKGTKWGPYGEEIAQDDEVVIDEEEKIL